MKQLHYKYSYIYIYTGDSCFEFTATFIIDIFLIIFNMWIVHYMNICGCECNDVLEVFTSVSRNIIVIYCPFQTKGTSSFGKRHNKTHTLCRRCGKSSYHIQKSRCACCGYPDSKIRSCKLLPSPFRIDSQSIYIYIYAG